MRTILALPATSQRRRGLALAAAACALALAIALPALAATSKPLLPPDDAGRVTSGNYTVSYWVTPQTNLTSGDRGTVQLVVAANGTFVRRANATVSGASLLFDAANDSFTAPNGTNASSIGFAFPFTVKDDASGPASYAWTIVVDGTTVQGNGTMQVAAHLPAPAPAPGVPRWAYYVGGLVVLAGLVAIVVTARQRSVQRRMRGTTRSQALREAELEEIAEKKPERAEEIKQELRAQETVREKRREQQILEAKRADVLKGMDLLKKRHELGALSKHQYDSMLAKRQAELAKIDADIAQMEAEDAAGGSAAA